MTMWFVIMLTALAVAIISLIYLGNRLSRFSFINNTAITPWRKKLRGFLLVLFIFTVIAKLLNLVNAIVCAFYFAIIWLICDIVFAIITRKLQIEFKHYYAGIWAIGLSLAALVCGWYLNHNVWQTDYTFYSSKITQPIKIAMFADSHLGTTFKADGFAKHLATIQEQKPDMLVIAGDFIDDNTKKEDLIAACKRLGEMKTKYGVYFVFGNHDEGYYAKEYRGYGRSDLVNELRKNNVVVLEDETKLLDEKFYLIGRKDASADKRHRSGRLKMADIVRPLNKDKYIIVIDHQPNDYANQAEAKVDLVLSGHTHGGQLFPLNQVGKWIGANNHIYGHKKSDNTDFIVTSGISDWAMMFKTGTKSEFVIINIKPK